MMSVAASTAYVYRIRATNAVGDSTYSATASVTTPVAPTITWTNALVGTGPAPTYTTSGGTYTLKGKDFTQTAVYGLAATLPQVNGKNTYTCKLEDDKWHHSGKLPSGTTLAEVWERVKE